MLDTQTMVDVSWNSQEQKIQILELNYMYMLLCYLNDNL